MTETAHLLHMPVSHKQYQSRHTSHYLPLNTQLHSMSCQRQSFDMPAATHFPNQMQAIKSVLPAVLRLQIVVLVLQK